MWLCSFRTTALTARTPASAVGAFVGALQRAVSCVTNEVLGVSADGYKAASSPHRLAFHNHDPVRLAGGGRLSLRIEQYYRVRPEGAQGLWKVETAAYLYTFYDAEIHEILAYHWHPQTRTGTSFPHLHLSYGLVRADLLERAGLSQAHNGLRPDFVGAHLPTRRIALEDVLQTAIEQLGVEPRRVYRRDWDTMLQKTRALFKEDRTWV